MSYIEKHLISPLSKVFFTRNNKNLMKKLLIINIPAQLLAQICKVSKQKLISTFQSRNENSEAAGRIQSIIYW